MIVVRVELHSAITGDVTELARMHVTNTGNDHDPNHGDYDVVSLRGRSKEMLDKGGEQRRAKVLRHPRLAQHVWNLVAKALRAMDYGDPT